MKAKSSTKKHTEQRPRNQWPLFWRTKTESNWRAKHYKLKSIFGISIFITLRRFNTSPLHRSKQYSQIIIRLNTLGVKELALCTAKSKAKNKKSSISLNTFKPSYTSALISAGLIGVLVFGFQVAGGLNRTPPVASAESAHTSTEQQSAPTVKHLTKSTPTSLMISSIKVNVDIKSMGQATDGTIETPGLFENVVGWYKFSPTPGEIGPAVILGHVDTYKGPSVFWRLGELKAGDDIQVTREDGSTATFKVTALEQYSQSDFPTEKVYGNTSDSELRLITCGGTYNYSSLRYNKNTVVYATIVL